MRKSRHLLYLVAVLLTAMSPGARAALRIDVGQHVIPTPTNQWQIPIRVTGGDLVTDMAGAVQVGWDGGPLVGGQPGPVIKAISYAASIWEGAAGGYETFNSIALTNQLLDPNVSLKTAGRRVAGQGLLFTLTIDATGYGPGLYELKLAQVQGLSTTFQNGLTNVPVTIVNGVLAVGTTVPTVVPSLGIGSLTNGWARLSWPNEIGRRYRVQWKSEVSSAWSEVRLDITNSGPEAVWVDDGTVIGSAPSLRTLRAYRLRVTR